MWGDSCRGRGERRACRSQEQRGDQARVGVEPKRQGGVTKAGAEAGEQRGARVSEPTGFVLSPAPSTCKSSPALGAGDASPSFRQPSGPHLGSQHTPHILSLQSPSFMGFKYFLLAFCHCLTQLPEDPGASVLGRLTVESVFSTLFFLMNEWV